MQLKKWLKVFNRAFDILLLPIKLRHTLASEMYEVTKRSSISGPTVGTKGTSATDFIYSR